MGFWLRFLFLGFTSIVLIVFAVHNRAPASLSLFPLPLQADVPIYMVVLGCFAAGFGCASVLSVWGRIQLRLRQRGAQQKVHALENELSAMRLEKQLTQSTDQPHAAH